jgi:hypothetical protein
MVRSVFYGPYGFMRWLTWDPGDGPSMIAHAEKASKAIGRRLIGVSIADANGQDPTGEDMRKLMQDMRKLALSFSQVNLVIEGEGFKYSLKYSIMMPLLGLSRLTDTRFKIFRSIEDAMVELPIESSLRMARHMAKEERVF